MPTLTGWEAVVLAMKAEGVPYVFGLPGDPRHLYDALVAIEPDGGPRPIGIRFETSGAFMVIAYARVTNQIAACFGCLGPGIANLMPGILEAYSGCTPMLVLGVRSPARPMAKARFRRPTTSLCSPRSRSGPRRSSCRKRSPGRCGAPGRSPPAASRGPSTSSSPETSVWGFGDPGLHEGGAGSAS